MEHPEVKTLIDEKLTLAQTDKRVSAFKAMKAAEVAGVDEGISANLEKILDRQIEQKGSISKPTAVFVDKSSSMTEAIEVGKHIAAIVSGVAKADLFVYAFDTKAHLIKATGKNLSEKEWKALMMP
ncbi:MAG: hypothetical protein QNJ54_37335 [Prochloraceae cyanobacterium]|nr:hypothetical protein [Prochloraceae cyanobacterium]